MSTIDYCYVNRKTEKNQENGKHQGQYLRLEVQEGEAVEARTGGARTKDDGRARRRGGPAAEEQAPE